MSHSYDPRWDSDDYNPDDEYIGDERDSQPPDELELQLKFGCLPPDQWIADTLTGKALAELERYWQRYNDTHQQPIGLATFLGQLIIGASFTDVMALHDLAVIPLDPSEADLPF